MIRHIAFNDVLDGRLAHNKENVFELVAWHICPPTNSLDLKHFRDLFSDLDIKLMLELNREASDPLGPITDCYGGWEMINGKQSENKVLLHQWTSLSDESHFKGTCRDSTCEANQKDIHKTFLEPIKDLEHRRWFILKEHLHFKLAIWSDAWQVLRRGYPDIDGTYTH